MEEESCEMHSEDDKALKNTKRIVKTHAQVQGLEKFYNEHKYPTDSMKIELAESIGLTEKQVSGWFCHRRLKDKKLMIGKQERSSGVSGHRQDSCGSTKQGDDKNREVESGRPEYSGNCNRKEDGSPGSSSSLRNISNSNNHNENPPTLGVPKFTTGVKTRTGPSGYLKVKGRVENGAITAVKKQLGKNYMEDGPQLGIEFDPVPPGAFESSMQDPVDETNQTGEDVPKIIHHHPKFGNGCEYNSSMAPRNSSMDRTSFKTTHGSDIPENYVFHQKLRKNTSLSNNGAYYHPPRNNSLPELLPRSSSSELRMVSVSTHCHLQPYHGKGRDEGETRFHKYSDGCTKISRGENVENESFNMSTKGYQYQNSLDKVPFRPNTTKGGEIYGERRIPFKNDFTVLKRIRDEFPQQQRLKRPSVIDNQEGTYRVIRSAAKMASGFSGSAETDSSMD